MKLELEIAATDASRFLGIFCRRHGERKQLTNFVSLLKEFQVLNPSGMHASREFYSHEFFPQVPCRNVIVKKCGRNEREYEQIFMDVTNL